MNGDKALKRTVAREQAWGAIGAMISFVGAYCLIRYGLHQGNHPIGAAVGVALFNVVRAWINRKPRVRA